MRVVKCSLFLLGALISYLASRAVTSLLLTRYQHAVGNWVALMFALGVLIGLLFSMKYKVSSQGRRTKSNIAGWLLLFVLVVLPLYSWGYSSLSAHRDGLFGLLIYLKILIESIGFTLGVFSLYTFFAGLKLPSK